MQAYLDDGFVLILIICPHDYKPMDSYQNQRFLVVQLSPNHGWYFNVWLDDYVFFRSIHLNALFNFLNLVSKSQALSPLSIFNTPPFSIALPGDVI